MSDGHFRFRITNNNEQSSWLVATPDNTFTGGLNFYIFETWVENTNFYAGVDYAFVRKYSSSEPSVSIGSEESGSWTINGYTYTKRKKITITSTEDLTDYQVGIPLSQLPFITSKDEPLYITEWHFNTNLVQNLSYDEFKVNHNITHTCYWQNASENVSSVNLTLIATNLNDSITLYNVTFTNVAENQVVNHTYTIQQTDAHDTIEFKCIYADSNGNTAETSTSKVVENTKPTTPDVEILNSTIRVGETLYANAENSTDVDGDSLTYEYMFYNVNDAKIVQNWSTTNHYTIRQSDAHDTIRVYARAYDGYNYSDSTFKDIIVSNSDPEINSVTNYSYIISETPYNFSLSISDIDNDTLFDVKAYIEFNDSKELLKEVANYTSGSNIALIIPSSYYDKNVSLIFEVFDEYNGNAKINTTTYVYWAKLIPNYLDEKTHEPLNLSRTSEQSLSILYKDGSNEMYQNITQSLLIQKPVEYITISLQYPTNIESRSRTIEAGINNITFYMIDLTTTSWVLIDFYVLGVNEGYLELYTANEGIISTQKLDISQATSFFMIQNKDYQIRLYQDGVVKELGHISKSVSSTVYLQYTDITPKLTKGRGNIVWGAEFITNTTLKVYYRDVDQKTEKVCLYIRNRTTLIYTSCIENKNEISWSDIEVDPMETYEVMLTITKNDKTWNEIKYFRYGKEVVTPTNISSSFLKLASISILIILAVLSTVLNAHIMNLFIVALLGLFVYFGWLNFPVPLIALFGAVALFSAIRRGEGV